MVSFCGSAALSMGQKKCLGERDPIYLCHCQRGKMCEEQRVDTHDVEVSDVLVLSDVDVFLVARVEPWDAGTDSDSIQYVTTNG